jgi:hypothetical protein
MCVFCVCKTHRFSFKRNLRVFSAKNTRVFFWAKIAHVLYRQSLNYIVLLCVLARSHALIQTTN